MRKGEGVMTVTPATRRILKQVGVAVVRRRRKITAKFARQLAALMEKAQAIQEINRQQFREI